MLTLSRRQFVAGAGTVGLGLLAGCGRLPWQAQQSTRVYRIGLLSGDSAEASEYDREQFLQGLRELGYVEGQTYRIEQAWAEGSLDRLPGLAAELVEHQVDIIVANNTSATLAAKQATTSIPIVFAQNGDPIGSGTIASLAHPGGNVTGLSSLNAQLGSKRLELLKTALPSLSRVGVLWDADGPAVAIQFREVERGAEVLGVQLQSLAIYGPVPDLDGALAAATSEGTEALLVLANPLTNRYRPHIIALTATGRLPAMFSSREFAVVGGLMSYAANTGARWRRAAYYVDRILKGTKPADLPVEQPMTFDFVVNLKTAQALGLTFPNEIMLQVTEVIP